MSYKTLGNIGLATALGAGFLFSNSQTAYAQQPKPETVDARGSTGKFLEQIDKAKELLYCRGKCDDARVETRSGDLEYRVVYPTLRKEVKRDGKTIEFGEYTGLDKGKPLILLISADCKDASFQYEKLEDINLDGVPDKYTKCDGPTLDIAKLSASVRMNLQNRFKLGLDLLTNEIERRIKEYVGIISQTDPPIKTKK